MENWPYGKSPQLGTHEPGRSPIIIYGLPIVSNLEAIVFPYSNTHTTNLTHMYVCMMYVCMYPVWCGPIPNLD